MAHHVTILAATEDGTVDAATGDVDISGVNIGNGIEENTRVTLTGTEKVAGDGVSRNGIKCTRHTKGTVGHNNGSRATSNTIAGIVVGTDVGHFVSTV